MSGGFGRKGVMPGSPARRSFGGSDSTSVRTPRPASPAADLEDGLSPQARAFIAAERARGAEQRPELDPAASIATNATYLKSTKPKADRSMMLAYVLWWFGAAIGAHRFYLGAHRSGLAMLGLFWGGLVIGGVMSKISTVWIDGYAMPPPGIAMMLIAMVWMLLDVFLIPGLMRRYRASQRTDTLAHVFS